MKRLALVFLCALAGCAPAKSPKVVNLSVADPAPDARTESFVPADGVCPDFPDFDAARPRAASITVLKAVKSNTGARLESGAWSGSLYKAPVSMPVVWLVQPAKGSGLRPPLITLQPVPPPPPIYVGGPLPPAAQPAPPPPPLPPDVGPPCPGVLLRAGLFRDLLGTHLAYDLDMIGAEPVAPKAMRISGDIRIDDDGTGDDAFHYRTADGNLGTIQIWVDTNPPRPLPEPKPIAPEDVDPTRIDYDLSGLMSGPYRLSIDLSTRTLTEAKPPPGVLGDASRVSPTDLPVTKTRILERGEIREIRRLARQVWLHGGALPCMPSFDARPSLRIIANGIESTAGGCFNADGNALLKAVSCAAKGDVFECGQ